VRDARYPFLNKVNFRSLVNQDPDICFFIRSSVFILAESQNIITKRRLRKRKITKALRQEKNIRAIHRSRNSIVRAFTENIQQEKLFATFRTAEKIIHRREHLKEKRRRDYDISCKRKFEKRHYLQTNRHRIDHVLE
jgi:hypothetical protein